MITKEQLFVGVTYTDVSNELRKVTYISTQFVTYVKVDGIPRTTHLEVMLDVLSLIESPNQVAA